MSAGRFDRFSETYESEVANAIAFVRQEHAFFLEAKARRLLRTVNEQIGDPAALRFLDVGCGVGTMERFLVERAGAVYGVDISPAAVEKARTVCPSAVFLTYAGRSLPFDDASFDVAFAICVLHHVDPEERPGLVREMARVVRPSGVVFVAEHNPWNPLTRLAVHRCAFDDDVELLTRSEVASLLRRSGLALVETRYILFFPWRTPLSESVDDRLATLPLGAQHVVAAVR